MKKTIAAKWLVMSCLNCLTLNIAQAQGDHLVQINLISVTAYTRGTDSNMSPSESPEHQEFVEFLKSFKEELKTQLKQSF